MKTQNQDEPLIQYSASQKQYDYVVHNREFGTVLLLVTVVGNRLNNLCAGLQVWQHATNTGLVMCCMHGVRTMKGVGTSTLSITP